MRDTIDKFAKKQLLETLDGLEQKMKDLQEEVRVQGEGNKLQKIRLEIKKKIHSPTEKK